MSLISFGMAYSQVGVNTNNPQGVFNIDGGKDNPTTGAGSTFTPQQQLNDVVVLPNGNMGIGTINPDTKLDIRIDTTPPLPNTPVAGFKLVDGNQGAGKVLQTDATGLATWVNIGKRDIILGKYTNSVIYSDNVVTAANQYKYSGAYIQLKPGKYVIKAGLTTYIPVNYPTGYSYYWSIYLSSSNTDVQQSGFSFINGAPAGTAAFGGRMIKNRGNTSPNLFQGSVVVNVTNTAGVTIYLMLQNIPLYTDVPTSNGLTSFRYHTGNYENYFYALPIN